MDPSEKAEKAVNTVTESWPHRAKFPEEVNLMILSGHNSVSVPQEPANPRNSGVARREQLTDMGSHGNPR